MKQRWMVAAVFGAVVLGACGGQQEPAPPPAPTVNQDSIDAARRAAEQAEQERLEAERRAREMEMERRREEARRAREVIEQRVHFEFDRSSITPLAEDVLTRKVAVLRQYPAVSLRIAGHADERGSVEYNLALGQRRAQSVVDFLTGYGLDASRFEIVSYGEERPLVDESNEEAWAQNRRAEFTVTAGGDALNP